MAFPGGDPPYCFARAQSRNARVSHDGDLSLTSTGSISTNAASGGATTTGDISSGLQADTESGAHNRAIKHEKSSWKASPVVWRSLSSMPMRYQ